MFVHVYVGGVTKECSFRSPFHATLIGTVITTVLFLKLLLSLLGPLGGGQLSVGLLIWAQAVISGS